MPQEVIRCVSQIGCAQGMPSHITYADRQGNEISNRLEDFLDDNDNDGSSSEIDDDTYTENRSDQDSEDDGTTVSNHETTSSDDNNDDDLQGNLHPPTDDESSDDNDDDDPQGDPHPPANEMHDPAMPDPTGSLNPVDPNDDGDEGHGDANGPVDTDIPVVDGTGGSIGESEEWEGECGNDASSNATSTGEIDECEEECDSDTSSSVAFSEIPPTESEQFKAAEAAGQAAANSQVPSTESDYSRLPKQPVRLRQTPTTIYDENQITVNDACPLGRESQHATQHCNIWSQSSHGIPPIDTKMRRICGAHLTTIFSPHKCLPREVCASSDKKGLTH